MRVSLASIMLLLTAVAHAATVTQVVPVFDESLPGQNGSLWRSELRLHNSSDQWQLVTFTRALSIAGGGCSGQLPLSGYMAPFSSGTVRSVGCPGSAATVEFTADDSIIADSVIVNAASAAQVDDRCCSVGYQEAIPVAMASVFYRSQHLIVNLPGDILGTYAPATRHIHRMNLGFVNPNNTPITVRLDYVDFNGAPFVNGANFVSVDVPAMQMVQREVALSLPTPTVSGPSEQELWRINATSTLPFGMYASYVDNATNDATFIASH